MKIEKLGIDIEIQPYAGIILGMGYKNDAFAICLPFIMIVFTKD